MVELTPEQQEFIAAQVATGGFSDPTEVVQAGLELLRKAAERDYAETVEEIQSLVPDLKAGRGRPIEEADVAIRKNLGFDKQS